MPKYTVVNPIKHGGEKHMPGAEVEMDAKVAKPLLASGDIKQGTSPAALLGSSALPAEIELPKGKKISLDKVVQIAFKKSSLSIGEWNALAEADREAKLAETVEQMKAGK